MEDTTTTEEYHSNVTKPATSKSLVTKTKQGTMRSKSSKSKVSSPIEDILEAFIASSAAVNNQINLDKINNKVHKKLRKMPLQPIDLDIGPLRIVFTDTKGQYYKQICLSMCHGLAQFMIGAANILVLGYTLQKKDYHAILCTVGWHFFCVEAIICLSDGNNWGSIFKRRHRKLFHTILQICGMMCSMSGTVFVLVNRSFSVDPHGILGLITLILTTINMIIGPIVLSQGSLGHGWKVAHTAVGTPLFVCSSASFCLGVFKPSFKSWSGEILAYVLIAFIVMYTLFIVIITICRCVRRIRIM